MLRRSVPTREAVSSKARRNVAVRDPRVPNEPSERVPVPGHGKEDAHGAAESAFGTASSPADSHAVSAQPAPAAKDGNAVGAVSANDVSTTARTTADDLRA